VGSGDEKKFENIQYVMGVLLPLIGTWMGTVIAYYFSRENFDAANKSVEKMARRVLTSEEKLKATLVKDNMFSLGEIVYNNAIGDTEEAKINLKNDVYDFIESNKKGERLPIISSSKKFRYIIHKSVVNDFFVKMQLKFPEKGIAGYTLDDLLKGDNADLVKYVKDGAGFVHEDATLFEAQNVMHNSKSCQDIFVTDNGTKDGVVKGWITNSKIAEQAKV
jgi:hypothetical protein